MKKSSTCPRSRIAELEAALAASESARMASESARMASESARVRAQTRLSALEAELARLIEQIRIANARTFGAKSEKISPYQLSLFNEVEATVPGLVPAPEPELVSDEPRKRKSPKRIDISHLPRTIIEYELTKDERICGECGSELEELRVEVREVVKLIPAHFEVEEHRRHVYVCRPCSKQNAKDGVTPAHFKSASLPKLPIEKSWAHPSLIAHVLNDKYKNAMPLYRIAQDLKTIDEKIAISRQCMAGWVIEVSQKWLTLVHAQMKEKLLKDNLVHCDETKILVLKEPGRKPSSQSQMWLFATPRGTHPIHIFEYHPTRAASVPRDFFAGWHGTIMTDGYEAYYHLEGIDNLSCLVHIRREFFKIIQGIDTTKLTASGSVAYAAVVRIDEIFKVDRRFCDMEPHERKCARDQYLRPKLESFRLWLEKNRNVGAPKMALSKAIKNALKRWNSVMRVLDDGRFPLTNNLSERAIRPFCIGRKNWMFSDTPQGATASAVVYSIVSTAHANGCIPQRYLEWLLTELPNTENLNDKDVIGRFMPWSDAVPDACRMAPEASRDMPDDPIVDIEPHTLDER